MAELKPTEGDNAPPLISIPPLSEIAGYPGAVKDFLGTVPWSMLARGGELVQSIPTLAGELIASHQRPNNANEQLPALGRLAGATLGLPFTPVVDTFRRAVVESDPTLSSLLKSRTAGLPKNDRNSTLAQADAANQIFDQANTALGQAANNPNGDPATRAAAGIAGGLMTTQNIAEFGGPSIAAGAPKFAAAAASKLAPLFGADAATAAYRTQQAASRYAELTRSGASNTDALAAVAKEFPSVPEGAALSRVLGPQNAAAENAAQTLARVNAGEPLARTGTEGAGSLGRVGIPGAAGVSRTAGTTIDTSFKEQFRDATGAVDMGKFSDAVTQRVDDALTQGRKVVLWADQGRKRVEIVSVDRGMMKDASGQRWGTLDLAMSKGTRVEIGGGSAAQTAQAAVDTGNVIPFPGAPSDAGVAAYAPRPGPGEAIPGAVGPNVGEVLAKAIVSAETRVRAIADKTLRGEPITASQAADVLDYLKNIDPARSVEYDRILSPILTAERGAQSGIVAARLDAKIARRAASYANREVKKAGTALEGAQESAAAPAPFSTVQGSSVSSRLATPEAMARRENAASLGDLGARLDEATDATKLGYASMRDEQILRDASINTGKIDNLEVSTQISDTIRANPDGFAEATRRVSLPETLAKSADYLGVDIVELQKEMARRGFTAGENSAFLTAVNGTMARLGSELHAASGMGEAAYATAEARFLSFARSVGGANSEAGRTLNALRLQRPMAFINAQYAQDVTKTAAKAVERAAKEAENANLSGRSAAYAATREKALRDATAAYEAAVQRATTLGEQARTLAIIAADKGGLGANVRKYIATLDPNDIDSIIAAIKATATPSLGDKVASTLNIFKTMKSTLDFSAPFRQGLVPSIAHPLSAARAFKTMASVTLNEKRANRLLNEMLVGSGSARRRAAGLEVTDYRSGPLSGREEAFMSNALNNVPVLGGTVQATNRAYTMYLNKLRVDVFDNAVAAWDRVGLANRPNEEKGLAMFVNWATGRGDLPGQLNQAAPLLNSLFFAPRFAISRLETPFAPIVLAAKGQGEAAKLAAADLTKFVGAGLSLLTLAKMGGFQVEADPRSSSFGKVVIGPHTIDIWGGFQQNARYTAQFITGQSKSYDGRVIDMGTGFGQSNRFDLAIRYLRGKL
ncbi:MAG: hypothetical protein NUW01_18225, partial [Gemmatimonadaceae bacterium]|nr:hypothetical protein [Gemmatimonadaceae bacterium]